MERQIFLLNFKKDVRGHLMGFFKDIGKAWKSIPFQVEKARQIDHIINGQLDNDSGYEFYIKRDIMKGLNLGVVEMKRKGYVAMTVTRIKAGMVKNINLQDLNKHGCKILKIRTRNQVENLEARKPKGRASFQVLVRSEDGTWYTKDGENYSVTSFIAIKEIFIKSEVLSKRIKELEKLLALKQEVS